MYRIVVADDEHHVVDWIADLILGSISSVEVLTGFSGLDVINIIEKRIPHLAILDIRMPGMDGIAAAKQLLARYPACKVILLTAFDEFDLIYQVSNHPNIQYLLKSESASTILQTIKDALKQIRNEQMARLTVDSAKEKALLLQHFEQSGILGEVLFETRDQALIRSKLDFYANEMTLCAEENVILTLLHFSKEHPSRASVKSQQLLQLYHCLTDGLGFVFEFSILDIHCDNFLLLAQRKDAALKDEDIPFWHAELDSILTSFQNTTQHRLSYITHDMSVAWENIAEALDRLTQHQHALPPEAALQPLYGCICSSAIGEAKKLSKQANESSIQLQKALVHIATALSQYNQDAYAVAFDGLLSQKSSLASLPYSEQLALRGKLTLTWLDIINEHHLSDDERFKPALLALSHLSQQSDWSSYLNQLQKLAGIYFEHFMQEEWNNSTQTVHRLKEYICANLSSDLSVTTISLRFNYSQSYISRLFRRITKLTMSQYIKTVRLDEAKRLLRTSQLSVQEIAKAVGFDTAQYFSMVFRKEIGVTPSTYRQNRLA